MAIPSIRQLRSAAGSGDWALIDRKIPEIVRNSHYVHWASTTALRDWRVDIRDLGASIIAAARFNEKDFSPIRQKLGIQLRNDANNYAGFRAACALAEHGSGEYASEVMAVLKHFSNDEEVASIAEGYLRKLK